MFNPIESRKRLIQERIEKSFNDGLRVSEEIEKGRHGIYEDNAENRRKNRVGQEYGHATQQKELSGKQHVAAKPDGKESISNQAAWASDDALKRAAADEKANPEVREAAKKELAKREAHQKELEKRNGVESNSNLSTKDSKEIKQIDKKLKNLDYQMKQTIKERDADESYTPSDDPDDFDYYENTIAAQEKEIARLKKRKENILKELEKRSGSSDNGSVKEKPSSAKKKFIRDAEENGGNMRIDRFMEKNEKHFSEVLKKHGFDSWDDFQKYGEDGPDDYDKIWKKCVNAIPNSAFEKDDDKAAKKDEIIKKLKQNATESKEAIKAKSSRLKRMLEDGANKDDSMFMSKNESYFKDVLEKHGFDSWDDFEEWGADGADGDWDKYEKIFKTCFNKIPADKFSETKKSSEIDESHGEKLIDNALQQMGYDSGHKFEDRSVYAKQLSDWVNEFASKNDKTPSEMYDWLNDNMETLYNLDDMDTDELDEYSDFEGWDELNDIINEMSDAFENPDKEEADFEKTFLGALKSDMGELDNSRKGKAAQKKLVELARDFVSKNPDLNLTAEDWQDIIGGDVDESDEKYGKLKGFRKLSNALERFYDSLD